MTAMQRQRVVWSGFVGAPGVSTFYFTDAAAHQDDLHAFLTALANKIAVDVVLHIEPGGDVIDDSNGTLTGVWAGGVTADVHGAAGTAPYAAPAGFLVRWETATIVSGSRLRGRTYFVPSATGCFAVDGSIDGAVLPQIVAAASDFVGAVTPDLLVWQRPRVAQVAYVDGKGKPHKALSGRPGSSAPVIQSSVPDEVVVLRSRRD